MTKKPKIVDAEWTGGGLMRWVAGLVLAGMVAGSAQAASFAMTTEFGDGFGFVDADTISLVGGIGRLTAYTVWKRDQAVPKQAQVRGAGTFYAATASDLLFECSSKHYVARNLFLYDAHGRLVGQYDKPIIGEQPIPPQTGVYDQYDMACNARKPERLMNNFNEVETPLQTMIRAARSTLNDPRYVP